MLTVEDMKIIKLFISKRHDIQELDLSDSMKFLSLIPTDEIESPLSE